MFSPYHPCRFLQVLAQAFPGDAMRCEACHKEVNMFTVLNTPQIKIVQCSECKAKFEYRTMDGRFTLTPIFDKEAKQHAGRML